MNRSGCLSVEHLRIASVTRGHCSIEFHIFELPKFRSFTLKKLANTHGHFLFISVFFHNYKYQLNSEKSIDGVLRI